jgi:hypothetical protein
MSSPRDNADPELLAMMDEAVDRECLRDMEKAVAADPVGHAVASSLFSLFMNDLIVPTVETNLVIPPEGVDLLALALPVDFEAKDHIRMKRCRCGNTMYYTRTAPLCGCSRR